MAEAVIITSDVVEDFRKRKLLTEQFTNDAVDLDPVAGCPILGELTPAEIEVFMEFIFLEADIEEYTKEIMARSADIVADAIRSEGLTPSFIDKMQHGKHFHNGEEAEQFFSEMARFEYLKVTFWFSVRQRLQTFATTLSIRAGFTVCKTGLKYQE